MGICSLENCKNECFEQEDKCILHCDKNEQNNWIIDNTSEVLTTKWNERLVQLFWKCYERKSLSLSNNAQIPPLLNYKLHYENIHIEDSIILDDFIIRSYPDKSMKINEIIISSTEIRGELKISLFDAYFDIPVNIQIYDNVKVENINIFGAAKYDLSIFDINTNNIDIGSTDKNDYNHKFSEINISIISNIDAYKINEITIKHTSVIGKFLLNNIDANSLDCSYSTFEGKVEIKESTFNKTSFFKNTKFQKLADFYRTTFNEVSFYKTDFEDVSVFSEVVFKENIDFKYTKFLGYSIFRDTIIEKKLNLRNTIFDTNANANFLDITSIERERSSHDKDEYIGETTSIDVANRETARIIKDFYDKSNNIIEANKFYALEMKKREEELNKDISKGKSISEWLIFKLHSISSDHSQSWFLALFWICYFTFMYSFLTDYDDKNTLILNLSIMIIYFEISLIIGLFLDEIRREYKVISGTIIAFMSYLIYGASSNDFTLECFSRNINLFGKIGVDMGFGLLLYKVTIGYLVYQFVVSVRQNTRRK